MEILKVLFLFLGIWWTIVNLGRMHARNDLSNGNVLLQDIGISGFIYLQWIMP